MAVHRVASISRACAAAASVLLTLAACGPPSGKPGAAPAPVPQPLSPPLPEAQVFVLEAGGSQPEDTVAAVPRRAGRVIVLRRSAPDFGLFATLDFRGVRDTTVVDTDTARVSLAPMPGRYGVTVAVQGAVPDSATITFSYGTHFVAPDGARRRYGSDLAFEKQLSIGRIGADGMVEFLPTWRPGSDMLRASLQGPGRYVVAAPR